MRLVTSRLATPRIVLSSDSPSLSVRGTGAQPASGKGAWAGIASFWREFLQIAFTPYYPERHYMRGPGPACAAKRKAK